jgi:hypothetical protein
MKAYGYEIKSRKQTPSPLKEVSLVLSLEEIDLMIEFLNYVKNKHQSVRSAPGLYHSHLQDWLREPSQKPDIIILTEFSEYFHYTINGN